MREYAEIIVDGKINKVHFDNSFSLGLKFKSAGWENWRKPHLILRHIDKYSKAMRKQIQALKLHEKIGGSEFYRMYQADYDFIKRYWDGHDYVEFNNPRAFEELVKQNLVAGSETD